MAKVQKKRYWAAVFYPESLPPDWREKLTATGLPIAISPLHDRDTDPTGEPKKAHYHIILCYPGPTTFSVVKKLCDSLSQPIPIPLEAVSGMYRYHTHADNPDKVQYEESDRCFLGGFAVGDYVELRKSEIKQMRREIVQHINEYDIREYSTLIDSLLGCALYDLADLAMCSTLFLDRYITSRRFRNDCADGKGEF